jgi:hypothetical protein
MAAIKVFRADKRVFPVGKAIETAGDFHKLNRDGEKLEQILSACKPVNKPARVGSVFVFEFYDDAESLAAGQLPPARAT